MIFFMMMIGVNIVFHFTKDDLDFFSRNVVEKNKIKNKKHLSG